MKSYVHFLKQYLIYSVFFKNIFLMYDLWLYIGKDCAKHSFGKSLI